MLSSHGGRLHIDLTAAPATYAIDGHQFQGIFVLLMAWSPAGYEPMPDR
jgi:hypothetical protein